MARAERNTVGSAYGRYETLFRIAAGGMAEVYAARVRGEAGFEKVVALKRMLPHLAEDERFVTMFMDEGKLAANISSPNVVSTLDLGRADDGSLYLAMELVVGTALSTILQNAAKDGEGLPLDVAIEIIVQAAHGLHDAHEACTRSGSALHIVHRDVSPQNILVGLDGRVCITDFGVARAILRRTTTSTGELKGKLAYFSPEQCRQEKLDRRSDVFALGAVAWETLTTKRLFSAENPLAVLDRVTRLPIPRAHTARPDVPVGISGVVAKALERNRDERFATAADFAQALRAASHDSLPLTDRSKVSALVRRHGGEALARMQRLLVDTSSVQGAATDLGHPEAPQLTSGIVVLTGETEAVTEETEADAISTLMLAGRSRARTARTAVWVGVAGVIVAATIGVITAVFRDPGSVAREAKTLATKPRDPEPLTEEPTPAADHGAASASLAEARPPDPQRPARAHTDRRARATRATVRRPAPEPVAPEMTQPTMQPSLLVGPDGFERDVGR